ncbi:MAG: aldehyde dehydrogenase family protein [Halocynthiibacter sp.]
MSIKDIMNTMDYGPALEGDNEARAWIERHDGAFGQFINGSFTKPRADFETRTPATGEKIATLTQASQSDIDTAVTAARKAQHKWAKLGGHGRARILYALARLLQKHARLFAVLETIDNGKPIRESRDIDIPLVARHFYYHAGMAQLMERELPEREALGVCGQIIPWNFPMLMLAWKIAPAIAMGNTVVLKPAEFTSLTALLFAKICGEAGVPDGVINIVTGDGAVGEMIVAHKDIDKIAFTGSTSVGRRIREATAGTGKSLTLELGGKSPYIVFDDADLDSAVEGLVDAIWFNQGQVCCAGSRLLVQEGIADVFYAKLKARMATLRVGNPLDKSIDVGAIVDQSQLQSIAQIMVANNTEGTLYHAPCDMPETGYFYPPTLVTDLSPSSPLMQEEIFGPVLAATTFRTPAEAAQIANNSRYGLAASVWSENVNLALDMAPKLCAGVVWVNATNLFDAAAGFGGKRESGFGREGGWEGLSAYTKPKETRKKITKITAFEGDGATVDPLDRTAKFYVGGKQTRPDSGYSRAIYGPKGNMISHVGIGSRKDIRNAVEAAAGATSWAKTTGHLRAQILYYIAENLSARAGEFAERLNTMQGGTGGKKEVNAAIDTLFTYAAWADKYDGQAHGVPIRGIAIAMNEALGTIGVICPDEAPLLGLVATMAPIIAMGNTGVFVPSEAFPLAATDFYQILDTSDVPAGVVNIITGSHAELAATLADHLNVDAVWSFSSSDISADIERRSAGNLKRTWVNTSRVTDWSLLDAKTFLAQATDVKNIWVPYGE